MRFHSPQRRSGIALIIVMITVMVLTILAGGFAYSMKVETRLALRARNYSELESLGRSGMFYAMWELQEEQKVSPRDGLYCKWAGGPGSMMASNSPIADFYLNEPIPIGKGEVTVRKITDQERLLNINTASDEEIQTVLMDMGVDAGDVSVVVNSIRDWIDPDDAEQLQGAENSHYEGLKPPYEAKNGPMDDISELLLVQGVTQEMYDGGGGVGYVYKRDPRGGSGRYVEEELPSYPFGLRDKFTTLSAGQINGLTISRDELALLPGMDEALADQYCQMRAGPDGVEGTEDDMLPPANFISPDPAVQHTLSLFGQRSTTFRVEVDAKIGGSSQTFVGVVVRLNPNDIRLVDFRPKETE